jgi:hypothetical protein
VGIRLQYLLDAFSTSKLMPVVGEAVALPTQAVVVVVVVELLVAE